MNTRIRSYSDLESVFKRKESPIISLFSGGLDSCHLLFKLRQMGVTNIHALYIDLGQQEDIRPIAAKAKHLGATLHVVNAQQDFIESFIRPAITAQLRYLHGHPISASLSRPCIATKAVELSKKIGSKIIVHTACPDQNSLRRYNGSLKDLNFDGSFGSPLECDDIPRTDKITDLRNFGLDISKSSEVSTDCNLWCREFESGPLSDPEHVHWESAPFSWTISKDYSPQHVQITFKNGTPTALNGESIQLNQMIAQLNETVGAYGIGRYIGLEQNALDKKVQEIREMPAAMVLMDAYRRIESATIDSDLILEKQIMEQSLVKEAVEGRWFGAKAKAQRSYINECAKMISGDVSYYLERQSLVLRGVVAHSPMYDRSGTTLEAPEDLDRAV